MICFLDRNDELFRLLDERCNVESPWGNLQAGKECLQDVYVDADGAEVITFDGFSSDLGPFTIEAKRIAAAGVPYMPPLVTFRLITGQTTESDGSNIKGLPSPRICEPVSVDGFTVSREVFLDAGLESFRIELEHHLGRFLKYDNLGNEVLEGDRLVFEGVQEMEGVPPELQQVYPTDLVEKFAEGIDLDGSLEEIMSQFKRKFAYVRDYRRTVFGRRGWEAPDLFVCTRSAHEIFATGYMFGCGEFATAWMSLLEYAGLENRLVKFVGEGFRGKSRDIGHDMVEVMDPEEDRWILTDPTMGRVYRDYCGESQFIMMKHGWIRMGAWQSNWDAGCFSKGDSRLLRESGLKSNYVPEEGFASLDGTQLKAR